MAPSKKYEDFELAEAADRIDPAAYAALCEQDMSEQAFYAALRLIVEKAEPPTPPQIKYEDILARQKDAQNPLLAIIIALSIRLEEATELIEDFNTLEGEPGLPAQPTVTISSVVKQFTEAQRLHIVQLGETELFTPLILKVQLPLASNDPERMTLCLVYNEDRSLQEHMTLDANILSWFKGDVKMYVRARLWIDGTLQIIDRTENQGW